MTTPSDIETAVPTVRGTRPRCARIEVWCTPDERAEIERRAALTRHSLSAYLRHAGLGHPIRSALDYQAVRVLAQVAADVGRLGRELKRWLDERPGDGVAAVEVVAVLRDIRELQTALRDRMGAALSGERA